MNRVLTVAMAVVGSFQVALARDSEGVRALKPVVKADNCFVYCLKGSLRLSDLDQWRGDLGVTIISVSRASGEMRVLASTGLMHHPTRRVRWSESRLVGLVAKAGHLYLAFWQASSWDQPPRSLMGKANAREEHRLSVGFGVAVYDLKSGELIGQTRISADEGPKATLPKAIPEETSQRGVFEEKDGKVSIFGALVSVEDGKLKWTDAPGAEPPPAQPKPIPE